MVIEKNVFVLISLLYHYSLLSTGEILHRCDLNQECTNSHWKNFRLTEGKEKCQELCSKTKDCHWYTYIPHSKLCIVLKECINFKDCKDCITSQIECPRCFKVGRCEGTGIRVKKTTSAHQCLNKCSELEECKYLTFVNGLCGLYKNCTVIINDCKTCVTAEVKNCKYESELPRGFTDSQFSTKILIVGGYSQEGDAKPEIIDLENPNYKCFLEESHKRNIVVKATLVNESFPLLCGYGLNFFKGGCRMYLSTGEWKFFPEVFNRPIHGTGEAFVPGKGWWVPTSKTDTEIVMLPNIKTNPGPQLPTVLEQHCMVQINDFETMVIGGRRIQSPNSAKTWIFNWSKKEWRFGPDLIDGRTGHVCGLYKNKFLVVGGGNTLGKGTTNKTEILDLTAVWKGWRNGPDLPCPITGAAIVQINDFNIIIVGGRENKKNSNSYVNALYQFQLDGWIRLTTQLQMPRSQHSALWIPDVVAQNCMKHSNNYLT